MGCVAAEQSRATCEVRRILEEAQHFLGSQVQSSHKWSDLMGLPESTNPQCKS